MIDSERTTTAHGPLRVLLCTGEFPPDTRTGGIGTAVQAEAAALATAGIEVHVLHAQTGLTSLDVNHPDGFVLHRRRLPTHVSRLISASGLLQAIGFRVHASRLGAFDVVEAPEWEAGVAGFGISPNQPTVAVLYTPTELAREHGSTVGNRFRLWLERWGVRRSAAAVSCGPNLARVLLDRGWHDARGRIDTQPPCLPRKLLKRECTPLPDEAMVLGVGRIEPRKGFDLLIRAVARLADPTVVTLVGRDVSIDGGRSYGDDLMELASELGVSLQIVPAVAADALGPWYERSWVVAIPSTFESFSMVGLEAAAHGRCVISTDDVGFAMLADDAHGVRVAPRSPEGFADALAPIVSDKNLAEAAGHAARQIALEHFGPEAHVARRLELYRSIMS